MGSVGLLSTHNNGYDALKTFCFDNINIEIFIEIIYGDGYV